MFNINLIRINGKPGTDTPETPDQIPATGDITNLGLWIACAIVSLGAICAVIVSDITLTTEERLVEYMERQLQILREDGENSRSAMEQYRQELTQEAKNTASSMRDLMKDMAQQAGKMREEFGSVVFQEQERMKRTSKKLFWISMIPSLILVVWELTRHIWLPA